MLWSQLRAKVIEASEAEDDAGNCIGDLAHDVLTDGGDGNDVARIMDAAIQWANVIKQTAEAEAARHQREAEASSIPAAE